MPSAGHWGWELTQAEQGVRAQPPPCIDQLARARLFPGTQGPWGLLLPQVPRAPWLPASPGPAPPAALNRPRPLLPSYGIHVKHLGPAELPRGVGGGGEEGLGPGGQRDRLHSTAERWWPCQQGQGQATRARALPPSWGHALEASGPRVTLKWDQGQLRKQQVVSLGASLLEPLSTTLPGPRTIYQSSWCP